MTANRNLITLMALVHCLLAEAWVQPESWTTPIKPFPIDDGLYYVGTEELAAYLLVADQGHVLIDAPLAENAGVILDNVRELGFQPADIALVLATHGHFDHVGGLAEIVDATEATFAATRRQAAFVQAGGSDDFFLGDSAIYAPVRAGRLLDDGEVIAWGAWRIEVLGTPGHTRGCTSYRIDNVEATEPREAVLTCSLSVLPGYVLAGNEESYAGIGDDFCASLSRFDALRPSLFLSNHSSFMALSDKRSQLDSASSNPFVDPEGYRRYLADARRKVDRVLVDQGGRPCDLPSPR